MQDHRLPVHPQLGRDTPRQRRLGASRSTTLVQSSADYQADHRVGVPACDRLWLGFRIPAAESKCLPANLLVVAAIYARFQDSNTKLGDRAISVLGLVIFQTGFWASSTRRSEIPWLVSGDA